MRYQLRAPDDYAAQMSIAGYLRVAISDDGLVYFDSERDIFGIVPDLAERVGYLPSLRGIREVTYVSELTASPYFPA